jgi:toxin ParE1/3/4
MTRPEAARGIRVSRPAQADIAAVLRWSSSEFGPSARQRYAALITTALQDLLTDPARIGARERPELGYGLSSYHLQFSRRHVPAASGVVRLPRHLPLFRVEPDGTLAVLRLLHDAMEMTLHLPSDDERAG